MTALIARLSSPARYVLLLSTCLLLIFGSTRSAQAQRHDNKVGCVTAYPMLNIRSGPSTNYSIVGYAPWGSQVLVEHWDGRGGWKSVRISRYHDVLIGWAKTSWLNPVPVGLVGDWCPNWLAYTASHPYGTYPRDLSKWTPEPTKWWNHISTAVPVGKAPPTAVPTWKPPPTAVPTRGPVVSCNIKGNISYYSGEKIYHVPGQQYYYSTIINTYYGERWFCSEAEARAAGWRKSYK